MCRDQRCYGISHNAQARPPSQSLVQHKHVNSAMTEKPWSTPSSSTHACTCTRTAHVPCCVEGAVCVDLSLVSSRMRSCWGDPHRPAVRHTTRRGSHRFRADPPLPSPPPHILLWSLLGMQGNLAAYGVSLSHILCGQIRLHQQQLRL